jgi:hypothetical protein
MSVKTPINKALHANRLAVDRILRDWTETYSFVVNTSKLICMIINHFSIVKERNRHL